jgi:hypothetical protein
MASGARPYSLHDLVVPHGRARGSLVVGVRQPAATLEFALRSAQL